MNKRRKLIKKLISVLGVEISPVNQIHKLEDKSDTVYLWDLNCSDSQAEGLRKKVKSQFVKKNSREPKAIHIITNNIDNFDAMGPGQIREVFGPWLDQAKSEE